MKGAKKGSKKRFRRTESPFGSIPSLPDALKVEKPRRRGTKITPSAKTPKIAKTITPTKLPKMPKHFGDTFEMEI